MMKRRKMLAAVGGMTMFVLGSVVVLGLPRDPATTRIESVYHADGPVYGGLSEMVGQADVVARIRVVEVGKSYITPFDSQAAVRVANGPHVPPTGLVKTDAVVEVLETLRGDARNGTRMTIVQLGGTEPNGSRVMTDKDPLLRVGDQELVFLERDPATGKFFTVGGGQGRFVLARNGTVSSVDAASVVGRRYHGDSQSGLSAEIRALP